MGQMCKFNLLQLIKTFQQSGTYLEWSTPVYLITQDSSIQNTNFDQDNFDQDTFWRTAEWW